jgi:hypothetical protein
MSSYGQIAYEDMALLNAQWQQARPAMAGLGAAVYGQHEYRDVSLLNARLRSILPAEVGLSPDGLGAGSISGNSIGAAITLPEVTIVGDPGGSGGGYSAGGTNWLLYGGAFAAIAIGGALIYRASKKR